jgi:hypothetical protein
MSSSTKQLVTGITYKGMSVKLTVTRKGMTPTDVVSLGRQAMRRYLRDVANRMVSVIQSITPSSSAGADARYIYPHTLTDSITYNIDDRKTNFAFQIGVDGDNWTSETFEELFRDAYHKNPPWGTVGTNKNTILYELHEYWDVHANAKKKLDSDGLNKMGLPPPAERARQKDTATPRPYGLRVGGKFIYRGVRAVWDNAKTDRLASLYFNSFFNFETYTSQLGTWANQEKPKGGLNMDAYTNQIVKIDTKVRDWI